mmetsp:Transcript_1629/g.2881  ORF Transcript_1629/g.2881 Transcript_1629/m.2881 type:complete len:157 (-) Transcript_1629:230-700(-)|eukprot:CAMPEP_0168615952 /NCGR_PEP_ID=MMETSP0449_2-20121227/4771_1 /TAXON_ID=1082188 /ORGANISM="Strombidium rassoulzadegani, Strain ras09" /LENGTH=156 /DNA_ID=CAMNT_0008656711 /DNA_START=243 /DNA_END=713 /DNA_ORIENTATION=+
MPLECSPLRLAAVREFGVRVEFFDPSKDGHLWEMVQSIKDEKGEQEMLVIPPADLPQIMAGQGTAVKELLDEVDGRLDYLFVCHGGGGMICGATALIKEECPGCQIHGVEPSTSNVTTLSLQKGEIQFMKNPQTIADGSTNPTINQLTFDIIKEHV